MHTLCLSCAPSHVPENSCSVGHLLLRFLEAECRGGSEDGFIASGPESKRPKRFCSTFSFVYFYVIVFYLDLCYFSVILVDICCFD